MLGQAQQEPAAREQTEKAVQAVRPARGPKALADKQAVGMSAADKELWPREEPNPRLRVRSHQSFLVGLPRRLPLGVLTTRCVA